MGIFIRILSILQETNQSFSRTTILVCRVVTEEQENFPRFARMRLNTKAAALASLPVLASAQSLVTVPVVINGYTTNIGIPAYTGQSTIVATVSLAVATLEPSVIYGSALPPQDTQAPPANPQGTEPASTPTIVPVDTAAGQPAAVPLATNAPAALDQPYGAPVTPPVVVQPTPTDLGDAGSATIQTTNAAGMTVPVVVPIPAEASPSTYTTTSNGTPVVIVAQVPVATDIAGSVVGGVGSTIAGAGSTATAAVGGAASTATAAVGGAASTATAAVGSAASTATAAVGGAASTATAAIGSAAASASDAVTSAASEAAASASSVASEASAAASSLASEASAAASSASDALNSATSTTSLFVIASPSASASNAANSLSTAVSPTSASPTAPVPTAENHAPDVRIPGAMIAMSCLLTVALAWVLSI